MSKILTILELGNPLLREIAEAVVDLNSQIIQDLIENMKSTLNQFDGVGLAAPQVGVSSQVILVSSRPNKRYPWAPVSGELVMINPRIKFYSENLEKDWEGCLSIPGLRGLVPRSSRVLVEFTNEAGDFCSCDYQGFLARVIQHEVDHLNGLFFLDRIESSKDLITEKEYLKLVEEK